MTDAEIKRLRERSHVHDDYCYGQYEPCGEHHGHDDKCGGRPLLCRQREDKDLVALLAEFDCMRDELARGVERDQRDRRARGTSRTIAATPTSAVGDARS